MEARKLTTADERLEGARLIATAFLHNWDEEAERARLATATDDVWGLFDDDGTMDACIQTKALELAFEGTLVPAGELEMVGSLPERRGGGAVRTLMGQVLSDFRDRGDLFALLIPFSFAFYRKFGFELASRELSQRLPSDQLRDFACDLEVRRATTAEDAAAMRALHDRFVIRHNLMCRKGEDAWKPTAYGEFGERGWGTRQLQHYSYLFGGDLPQAYLTFVYVEGANGPFRGSCKVVDCAYESVQALRSMLGFVWGLRAKVVDLEIVTSTDLDLGLLIPESDRAQRSLAGHVMARALDVSRVLGAMRYPQGQGSFALYAKDDFMPQNTGCYQVDFCDGSAQVERSDAQPDAEMDIQTFTQLAAGSIGFSQALWRKGVTLHANQQTLERVFVSRLVRATL